MKQLNFQTFMKVEDHLRTRNVFAKVFQIIPMLLLFCSASMMAQTVSGVVTEDNGDPLIGATVQVKGSTTGTITDFDGSYSLNVPDNATELLVSYTGYKEQTIAINGRTSIDISLGVDSEILDEVVVVGYGVVRKSDLTGSVSSLDGAAIQSVVAGNPTSSLQGKIAGVQVENNGGQPGGDANVFVRGVSSLTNSYPLYVVDGTFVENMNFLNPKDIESMEILKDASSAAIYGSRAANGVVLITTKRGSEGSTPKLTLDVRGGVEAPSKYLDYLNGAQFVDYRRQLEANDGSGFVFPDEGVSTDWQDLSLNPGSIQDYGLSMSGGGENSKYFISGNYFGQDGILVGSNFERINLRANSEFKVGKLTISESISIAQTKTQQNNWFGFDGATAPILPESVPGNDGGFSAPDADIHGFGGYNDYGQAVLEDNLLTSRNLLGNVNVAYEIMDGLSAKLNFGADYRNDYSFFFAPTFFMSNTDAVINVNDQNDLTEGRSETLLTLIEPTLSYNNEAGKSRYDVVVGLTQQKIDFRNLVVYAQGLPNNNTQVIGAANPANVQALAGVNNVSGLRSAFGRINYAFDNKYLFTATIRRDASSKFAPDYRVGVFPSASVGWNVSSEPFWSSNTINRLKIRAGYGELGSQNIPDYAYQSVFQLTSATSFNNDPANGYAQTSLALEDLRWETSKTANIGVDMGFFDDKLTLSAEYYVKNVEDVLVGVAIPSSVGFSQPVIQNIGEIQNKGLDLELVYKQRGEFSYQIGANISTFNSMITSLPNPVLGPSTSEDQTRVNRFVEGEAPGVYWGYIIEGIYANQAEIDSDSGLVNDDEPDGRKATLQPGDFIRKDLNGDGIIDANDQTALGDPTPDFIYGLNFSGNYKKLDFGVFFQGVQGNEIYNLNKFYNIFWADDNKLTDVLDAWTPDNTATEIPRATAIDASDNRGPSSFFIEDGSYFRLRTLEIGYTLDVSSVAWMDNIRLFATAQNLFTITSYSGYDPDISSTNGGRANRDSGFTGNRTAVNPLLGRGLDARAYPNTRGFIFGLQATF